MFPKMSTQLERPWSPLVSHLSMSPDCSSNVPMTMISGDPLGAADGMRQSDKACCLSAHQRQRLSSQDAQEEAI